MVVFHSYVKLPEGSRYESPPNSIGVSNFFDGNIMKSMGEHVRLENKSLEFPQTLEKCELLNIRHIPTLNGHIDIVLNEPWRDFLKK